MGKSPVRLRTLAFETQGGRCFYCDLPMWQYDPVAFATRFRITARQAKRFRCTAEHLVARCEGGKTLRENIVAACWYCNSRRQRIDGKRFDAGAQASWCG